MSEKIVTHDALRSVHTELERERVWAFFWDVPSLARCIPGCENVVPVEEGASYTASVRRQVGPFSLRVALVVTVVDRTPPSEISIEVRGEEEAVEDVEALGVGLAISPGPDVACSQQLNHRKAGDGAAALPVVDEAIAKGVLAYALDHESLGFGRSGKRRGLLLEDP